MTDHDHTQAQLADLKRRSDLNAVKRAEITAKLNADYPHLCDQCDGRGGEIVAGEAQTGAAGGLVAMKAGCALVAPHGVHGDRLSSAEDGVHLTLSR